MSVLFPGLVMVTGERDVGKTWFALECGAKPEEIIFFDHDLKTSEVVMQLKNMQKGFKQYHDMVSVQAGKKELAFYNACQDLVNAIPDDSAEALIWDNFTPFEDVFHPVVMSNPGVWRDTWSPMGAIKGAQQWQASFTAEEQFLEKLKRKAKLVFIIYHLKNLNMAGVKTEKLIPSAKRVVPQKANLSVWLRMNDKGGGKPIGLILKRFGKASVADDGSLSVTNVLPRKMVPCTWAEIRKYWEHPFGEGTPDKDQKPNAFELSILDGALTPDQRKSFELMLQFGTKDGEEEVLEAVAQTDQIKVYKTEHPTATPVEIKQALNLDMAIPDIVKAMN